MSDIKNVVEESFTRYAGNVIMNRAICDARDLLKPSARMLMYSQEVITKNIPSKPFVKSARVVGDALGHYYEHGDSSCYSTYMRLSKPFAMRYPLEDCQGNNGTLNSNKDEASMRYTQLRLSPLGHKLFEDIEKDTIAEWSVNFDETETYPKVLPSKGYYNICNGTIGLGIAVSSNIPQFNLREINEALIKLLWNPEIDFEEICVMPDFATGAIITNAEEIKESLKNGCGAAIKLRAVVEYDKPRRTLMVKELPYGLYTETLSKQIQELLERNPNCGIDNVNDASHKQADYEIYLSKGASPEKVLKLLYKETSLQSFFPINMTVLIDGKKPKIAGFKELLQSHISHEKIVYIRGFEYDLKKIKARLHIIEGLIKAYDMIDEVVQTIKSSSSSTVASVALQKLLSIDDAQAKAILDLKLSRLSKLDINKLFDEQNQLNKERDRIEQILNDETLLKKEIEKGLREVAEKFGDARRTKVLNIEKEEDEPIDNKKLLINLTNKNNIIAYEVSSLYTQKRGGVGNKLKLNGGEYVIATESCETIDTISFYSNCGKYYTYCAKDLPILEKLSLESIFKIEENEFINNMSVISQDNKFIAFITKNGLIKKSRLSDYRSKANGVKAIELMPDDEIRSTLILKNEKIGILTEKGYFLICETDDISPIGRVARGRKCISLGENDFVRQAAIIPEDTNEILFVTNTGYVKKINKNLIPIQGLNTKGKKVYKTEDGELMAGFLVADNNEVIVNTTNTMVKLNLNDIPSLSLSAKGVISVKLNKNQKVIGLS